MFNASEIRVASRPADDSGAFDIDDDSVESGPEGGGVMRPAPLAAKSAGLQLPELGADERASALLIERAPEPEAAAQPVTQEAQDTPEACEAQARALMDQFFAVPADDPAQLHAAMQHIEAFTARSAAAADAAWRAWVGYAQARENVQRAREHAPMALVGAAIEAMAQRRVSAETIIDAFASSNLAGWRAQQSFCDGGRVAYLLRLASQSAKLPAHLEKQVFSFEAIWDSMGRNAPLAPAERVSFEQIREAFKTRAFDAAPDHQATLILPKPLKAEAAAPRPAAGLNVPAASAVAPVAAARAQASTPVSARVDARPDAQNRAIDASKMLEFSPEEYPYLCALKRAQRFGGAHSYLENSRPVFVDHKTQISVMPNPSETAMRAALELAKAKGWNPVRLSGNRELTQAARVVAREMGLMIEGDRAPLSLSQGDASLPAASNERRFERRPASHAMQSQG